MISFFNKFYLLIRGYKIADNEPIISLLKDPVTTSAYTRIIEKNGKISTCFIIHEDRQHIALLHNESSVQIRSKLFIQSGVGLVTVLLKIGTEYYETWWNWHNPYCHSCFEHIANQEMLRILFFVDNHNCQFSLHIQNNLQKHFVDYIKELEDLSSWSMDDFNLEREKIYKMYPSPQSLWAIIVE